MGPHGAALPHRGIAALGHPMRAMVVMFIATACIALFTDPGIFSNFLSISTLFIFMLVAVT
jgi:hypothetical protein